MVIGTEDRQNLELYLDALKTLYSLLVINDDRNDIEVQLPWEVCKNKVVHLRRGWEVQLSSKCDMGSCVSTLLLVTCTFQLDDNARVLLKDLLDGVAKKVLKTASEVIVSIFGLSNKNSSTEQLQSQDSPDQATFLTRAQNTFKDINKQSDKVLQGQPINKRVPDDETVQSVASELSEMCMYAADLQKRKKRCRICRRSSAKQLKFENEKSSNNRDASGIVTSEEGLQNFSRGTEKKHKDIDCISKDASDAIKTIESRISALKVGNKHVSSRAKQTEPQEGEVLNFSAGSVSGLGTSSPNIGKNAGLVSQGDQTQFGHFVLGRNDPHSLSVRRKAWETKGRSRWCQLSRYVMNPMNDLKMPNQSVRSSALLSPWNVEPIRSMSENIGKNNEINLRGNTSQEENLEVQIYGLHKSSPVHVQNVKASVEKVEPVTRSTNSPSRTDSVQGLRIPLNSDKKSRKNSLLQKLPKKTKISIVDGNKVAQMSKLRKVGKTKPSVSASELIDTRKPDRKLLAYRAGNKQKQTRNKTAATSKCLIHQTTMRQTPLDNKCDQLLDSPVMYRDQEERYKGKVKKKNNQKGQQKMSWSDQQDSNGTNSNGNSSSSWTTQNGCTSYYDSEEYSVTDQSQVKQRSSTIEREGDYVSGSTQGRSSGYTSYSESESSSVPSSNQSLEDSNSSSKKVSYLPSDQISSLHSSDPSYRQGRFSRRYSSTDRRRPKIQTGRLKKLKDKVAVIFHHHHHHHHHHYADDSTQSDDQSHEYHGTPLSKHAARMFKTRNQAQAYGEKAAEKLSKSMVRHVPNKKRGANFNKLVDGLVRHVRHSKKSKKCKGGMKHQAKDQHVGKKLAKKVHWWQFLHRRPRRMKMPKKPHVKLGFGFKKSKLKAVPTIKWC